MKLSKYDSVYFLGIGGIGMSALARWFKRRNLFVAGYDRTPSDLTSTLEDEGFDIHYEDNIEKIPSRLDKEKTLVVFTPAIPGDHKELN
ncbi:MAG: Mur ligase domain-containing protein, partial [Fulvivirga sp.]|nr:Mur ligase domain-containing protein [Fulvivirga sp.]